MRDIISLACTECKRRNYSTTKNRKKSSERLEMSKYLPVLPEAHGAQGDEVRSRKAQVESRQAQGDADADLRLTPIDLRLATN